MGEDRRVAHHRDRFAIVLATLHEDGFANGCVHVSKRSVVLRHGIFAHIDMGRGFGLVVITSVLANEEFRGFVVVLILQFHRFRDVVEQVAVGDEVQIGPTSLDGVVELHITFHVVVTVEHELLLVTDLQIFQVEWLRVTVLGTQASIIGIGASVGILDSVERLLDEGVDVVFIHPPIVSDTHVHHKHSVGAKVFGQFEVFVVTLPVGHLIIPVAVHVARTFLDGTDGFLPLKTVGLSVAPRALDVATTREAHETRMHVGQHLSQIGTATVFAALERRREQTDDIQEDDTLLVALQRQIALGIRTRGSDFSGIFLPFLSSLDADGRAT